MLYYGDRTRAIEVARALAHLRTTLEAPPDADGLRGAVVEAGELAQGLLDLAFEQDGCDRCGPLQDAAHALVLGVAALFWRAVGPGDARGAGGPRARGAAPRERALAALDRLVRVPQPATVTVRVPEGYAHYALYPESFGVAALRVGSPPALVLGLRSIGLSLGAVVAAATGCAALVTARPIAHPYARALAAAPELIARVRALLAGGGWVAVVDEGPGASGSSLAAALRWLEELGAGGRAVVLPGHAGEPGGAASEATRARYAAVRREVASFEEVVLPGLRAATEGAELTDLSGGAWRARVVGAGAEPPPVFAQSERRKLLASAPPRSRLLRFAGVGWLGEEALALAGRLADEGFCAAPERLLLGFLVTPWLEARPLPEAALDRRALLAGVVRYLRCRARLPAHAGGASADRLAEAVRVNAREALGDAVALPGWLDDGARALARLPTVLVDGKLERWEWLVDAGGRLWKADALDHARGHDLVGPQPAVWDVVGAAVELGLTRGERAALLAEVAPETPGAAIRLAEAAYAAVRLGRWTFARMSEGDPREQRRIDGAIGRYRGLLAAALGSATPPPGPGADR